MIGGDDPVRYMGAGLAFGGADRKTTEQRDQPALSRFNQGGVMKEAEKKQLGENIVELVGGLLGEHCPKIIEAYEHMDNALPVNIRFTLKGDSERINITSTLTYSTEKVTDHANATIDLKQGTFEFNKEVEE